MEGKLDKVDKACENGRVQKVVERLYRKRLNWKQGPIDLSCFDHT